MPRNTRKKFRKFLEARHHRQKRGDGAAASLLWFNIFCAVLTPFLLGTLVALLWQTAFLYILHPFMYMAAYAVLLVWAVLAYHGAMHYWSKKADALFALSFVLLVGFGACWGRDGAVPVKAWITAPAYARQPSVQLETPAHGKIYQVLEGSLIHLSWQSEEPPPVSLFAGREEAMDPTLHNEAELTLTVPDTESDKTLNLILRRGWHKLTGWDLHVLADEAPQIMLLEEPETTLRKTIKFSYKAVDDYGIEAVAVRIAPTSSASVTNTEPVEIPLAAPTVKEIQTANYVDLTSLPWAGIPVTVQLVATDGAGQRGWSDPKVITLPTRTFHNPFARALIEERQKYLENPDATTRDETANVMAGIARQQGLYHGDPVVLMALRAGAVRLVLNESPETAEAVSDILWQTAVRLEEGLVGKARSELADAERDLSFSLMRDTSMETIRPFISRVHAAMGQYFDALEAERARQPPALQEMDWPLATASEMLTPDDLQSRLAVVSDNLAKGDRLAAREGLGALQALIENLRTTPPELTPDQAQIAQRVFALRALVRGQKSLIEDTDKVAGQDGNGFKAKKARRDGVARSLAQQQLLLSALHDIIVRQGVDLSEARQGQEAMTRAIQALQKQDMSSVQKSQTEALGLLETGLQALTDQMRRAMTAKAP